MKKTLRYKNFKLNIQGITLIALIITIVILLIITAVSINVVIDTGLFDTSKKTLDDAKQTRTNIQNQTNDLISEANTSENGIKGGTDVPKILIEYNGNGATSGSVDSQIKTEGVPITIQTNGFERTGYTFTGWNTSTDGTGTSYTEGETYTLESGLVLYAQWMEISNSPVIVSVSMRSRSTDYIYVYAKATDEDTAQLDYKLYIRAEGEEYTSTPAYTSTGDSGSTLTLQAENLTEYTVYYYYITVADETTTVQSEEYVSGTGCSGTGTTKTITGTSTCGNTTYCSTGGTKSCGSFLLILNRNSCPVHGYNEGNTCCSEATVLGTISRCDECDSVVSSVPHTRTVTCSHGYSKAHYYCTTHNGSFDSPTHTINYSYEVTCCEHGNTSVHYPN